MLQPASPDVRLKDHLAHLPLPELYQRVERHVPEVEWPVLAEAGYRTVRCDLRGFGDTPSPGRPYTDSDDVAALLGELAIDRVALIGASFGGSVALEVATRWPDQVTALVLICAGMPGHEPGPELAALGHRQRLGHPTAQPRVVVDRTRR